MPKYYLKSKCLRLSSASMCTLPSTMWNVFFFKFIKFLRNKPGLPTYTQIIQAYFESWFHQKDLTHQYFYFKNMNAEKYLHKPKRLHIHLHYASPVKSWKKTDIVHFDMLGWALCVACIMKENNIYDALNNTLLLTTLESTLKRSEYGAPLPSTYFGEVMYTLHKPSIFVRVTRGLTYGLTRTLLTFCFWQKWFERG